MEKKTSVLIVDDDETFCRFLAETVEGHEMRADWTTDGFEGYEMSLDRDYDLYIVDVRMPLVFGNELAEDIRADKPKAKIILISAFPDNELERLSKKLKVSLLPKPFSPSRLLQEITRVLAGSS
jgi:DNA-binding response OmpR family regulator